MRSAVIASGGECPEIYGDAAFPLPEVDVPKTHQISIILHVLQDAMFRAATEKLGADHIELISLRSGAFDEIEGVIGDISHAYGVPCQSLRLMSGLENARVSFKMRDYKLSVGLDDPAFGVPPRSIDLKWLEARECVLLPSPIERLFGQRFPSPSD